MLKISIVETHKERRLVLNGSLISPWTAELQSEYDRAKTELNGRELVINLDDVTTISKEGEGVLILLMNKGIRIRCRGVFTKLMVRHSHAKHATTLRGQPSDFQ